VSLFVRITGNPELMHRDWSRETGFGELIGDGYSEVIWEDNGGRQQMTAISEWDALPARHRGAR
jgi:hypothetical protein